MSNSSYIVYIVLGFTDVGRPRCRIVGGKCDKKVISVSDKFSSKDDDETMMTEFRLLKIPNDAKLQQIPDATKEREIICIKLCSVNIHIYNAKL